MPRHVGVVLAALLLLAIAASAAPAAPGDRAGTAAIRQATIDLHLAVVAQKAAIQASYRRFSDDPACATAIQGAPTDEYAKLIPEYVFPAMIEMEISPLNPALTAFAARLDQIPVRDSKLQAAERPGGVALLRRQVRPDPRAAGGPVRAPGRVAPGRLPGRVAPGD
jgi:hypothetical protein